MKTRLFFITMLALIGLSAHAQWQTTNGPFSGGIVQTLCSNGTNIFCGTQSGGAFIDNGTSWSAVNTGLVGSDVSCITNKGPVLYCTGGNGINKVYTSTNNGSNWDSINTWLNNAAQNILVYGRFLVAGTWGGATGGIFYSPNNGGNWAPIVTGWGNGGVNGVVVDTAIDSTIIIACVYGGAEVTHDDGNIWTAQNFLGGYTSKCILRSGSNVFIGTELGVYLTQDYGVTFSAVNSSMPGNNVVYSLVVDGSNIFAGSDSGVYVTSNNGLLWTAVNTGLTDRAVHSLATDGTNLYAGTATQGVWKRALSQMVSGINEVSNKNGTTIYPNPSNGAYTVESSAEISRIEIMNVLGEKIYSSNINSEKAMIDLTGEPKGMYFYKIVSKDGVISTGKLIVL
ncbi:MAG TPA: T9SS type A sorting domain-containing protein [Bacteroidia bacterium]|jgi:hypothetical protein|nr:T9SS type A sorting domain-containing protein [Bacteroidia bacterium]